MEVPKMNKKRRAMAEKAYNLRKKLRMTWVDIYQAVGYKSHSACMYDVKMYAKSNDLIWPLPKALSQGEVAYEEYSYCGDWEEVRKCINQSTIHRTQVMAYGYAKKHGKPWPIVVSNKN